LFYVDFYETQECQWATIAKYAEIIHDSKNDFSDFARESLPSTSFTKPEGTHNSLQQRLQDYTLNNSEDGYVIQSPLC
jgi:hypothetical protein